MTERLQKKIRPPKKSLTELLNDKSVLTGREVVQRIKDKEILRKQFEEAVEFEKIVEKCRLKRHVKLKQSMVLQTQSPHIFSWTPRA